LQIDKSNLRLKHRLALSKEEILARLGEDIGNRMSKDHSVTRQAAGNSRNEAHQSKNLGLCASHSHRQQMTSAIVGVHRVRAREEEGLLDASSLQVAFNYLTHHQVGRKRHSLF
jgi:hypothetical protein